MTERTLNSDANGIAVSRPACVVKLFLGQSGLRELAPDWLALCKRTGATALMQSPGYYLSYAEILAKDDKEILAAGFFAEDQLIAVLPLSRQVESRIGVSIRKLAFPRTPMPVRSYVASRDLSLEDLVALLKERAHDLFGVGWDVLQLDGLIDYGVGDKDQNSCSSGDLAQLTGKNNYIDVTQPDYVRTQLSANMRSNLKRRMKRLVKMGEFHFETVKAANELDSAYEKFVDTEAAGWKSYRGGKRAIKLHADQRAFYRDLLGRFSHLGDCHIHLLELNGECIAADFILVSGHTAYSVKHGYDERFADVTPSNLLREYTIDYYAGIPEISVLDLVSGYGWQDRWKPAHRTVQRVYFFNQTLKGQLLRVYLLIRHHRKWTADT